MEEFLTIKENIKVQIIEKKSKFIASLFYVESVDQAEDIIQKTKKEYFDARHNCIAYRIIENGQITEKSSDDGEPTGTAGAPMLNILQKNNLSNILIIVTRYFGGILLGTGGLVRAYSESLQKAIKKSVKVKKCLGEELEVTLDYNNFENFKYYCKINNINLINANYKEYIVCKIELEEEQKSRLIENYKTKKINLMDLKFLSKKFIEKSK